MSRLLGGGEFGRSLWSLDWAATPVGPLDRWPQSLRTAADICLNAPFPSLLWWGPELAMLYNGPACSLLGLGPLLPTFARPARLAWPEGWPAIAPLVQAVLERGEPATSAGPPPLLLSFACSPIHTERGEVGGVFCVLSPSAQPAPGARQPPSPGLAVAGVEPQDGRSAHATIDSLRASEARLRLALEVGQLGTWSWDPGHDRVAADQRCREICGLDPAATMSLADIRPRVHPDDWPRVEAALAAALRPEGDGRYAEELRFVHPDGAVRWAIARGQTLFDDTASRSPFLMLGTVIDISERARAEEALRESEARYRALTELSLHMVWTLAPDGEITYLSQKWFDYTGLSWEEVRRTGWERALHPDERGAVAAAFRQHLAAGGEYAMELRLRSRDGGYRWHLTRARPIADERGALLRWLGVTIDIDERKRAEEALSASEERYRSLTRMLASVVWQTDAAGAFVAPQPEWAAFTGQSWEEYRGWGWAAALHPDDRAQIQARWRQSLETGAPYEGRGRVWHAPGGAYHHFVAQAVPLRDADGTLREWIGTLTDTHEEEQRSRDSRFMADLAEQIRLAAAPDPLLAAVARSLGDYLLVRRCLIIDIDLPADRALVLAEQCRGVPSVTPAYRVSDYSPLARAEMESGHVIVNADAQLDPRTAAIYATTYAPAGERAYIAVPLMRDRQWTGTLWVSDDRPRPWEPREVALLETAAERLWLAVEKLRAEGALLAYAEKLLRLNAASLAINAAASLDGVLQRIADQARALAGAERAQVSLVPSAQWAQTISALSPAEGHSAGGAQGATPGGSALHALVCRTNQPLRLSQAELEAHPEWPGSPVAVGRPPSRGWLAVPLTAPDGHNIGLIELAGKAGGEFSATDEAVLLQLAQIGSVAIESARLYAAAQDAVSVRDQFLSIAAHELKTPLTSLLGYSQTLLRRALREASLGERDQRVLRQIAEQAKRLNRLIDALLDVGRIESGRLSIERAPLDLSALLRRCVEALDATLDRHSFELVGAEAPLMIEGDELRLEQVIQNLLSNAVKYSPTGGRVLVALERQGEGVRLAVSDQGVGIPQGALSQLFQRFYRVDDEATRHIAGMGIGLYVVQEIVGLHGGTVTVESAEGLGSTFVVRLPLSAAATP